MIPKVTDSDELKLRKRKKYSLASLKAVYKLKLSF